MSQSNEIAPFDLVAAGVKLITNEQRQRCAALASVYLDRFRLCSPDQRTLAETFRQGVLLLQEIAK